MLIESLNRSTYDRRLNEQGLKGSFEAEVVSVTSTRDEMGMSFGPASERRMPIQHPFNGSNSWIRSTPEVGTRFLLNNRADSGQPEAMKSLPNSPSERTEAYLSGQNPYRTLLPGEHDIFSSGFAATYYGYRGHLDSRSGASVKDQLSRDSMEATRSAPTHRTSLLGWVPGELGDESRVGIVKRWRDAATEFYPRVNGAFQAERYAQLKNPAQQGPVVLFDRVEGQVYGADGQIERHSKTGLPLRHRARWYATTDDPVTVEIDQAGNYLLEIPQSAGVGYHLIVSNSDHQTDVGRDRSATVGRDDQQVVRGDQSVIVRGLQNVKVQGVMSLTGQAGYQIVAGSGMMGVGKAGDVEPMVMGMTLQSLLGSLISEILSHSHASPGAPPTQALKFAGLNASFVTNGKILAKDGGRF